MSKEDLESVLNAARKLPVDEQHFLIEQMVKSVSISNEVHNQAREVFAALEAVEKTQGTMKNLDKETIKWLAEDEELCGY